jgi:hypothetical protein
MGSEPSEISLGEGKVTLRIAAHVHDADAGICIARGAGAFRSTVGAQRDAPYGLLARLGDFSGVAWLWPIKKA